MAPGARRLIIGLVPAFINLTVHASQFPERVAAELRRSLYTREVNHKFHYDTYKQTEKWLALHQACSPWRTDAGCAAIYEAGFSAAAGRIQAQQAHVIGLGCGRGQKDSRLLEVLYRQGKGLVYSPVDVSTPMVLVAGHAAAEVVRLEECHPLVCDLTLADDLPEVLARQTPAGAVRVITFFGMVPNFEPGVVLPRLERLLREGDLLLLSANLAPGLDYTAGVRNVLSQYDNPLTREWLLTFLLDLGVERADGELRFTTEEFPPGGGLLRIAARFHFSRPRSVELNRERFEFVAGETIRLFFSYRLTPALLGRWLGPHRLAEGGHWVTDSGEEGVFLFCK